jgi:hypothetical protein
MDEAASIHASSRLLVLRRRAPRLTPIACLAMEMRSSWTRPSGCAHMTSEVLIEHRSRATRTRSLSHAWRAVVRSFQIDGSATEGGCGQSVFVEARRRLAAPHPQSPMVPRWAQNFWRDWQVPRLMGRALARSGEQFICEPTLRHCIGRSGRSRGHHRTDRAGGRWPSKAAERDREGSGSARRIARRGHGRGVGVDLR